MQIKILSIWGPWAISNTILDTKPKTPVFYANGGHMTTNYTVKKASLPQFSTGFLRFIEGIIPSLGPELLSGPCSGFEQSHVPEILSGLCGVSFRYI